MSHNRADNAVTVPLLGQMKARGEKIAMLTAYDYTMARLMDDAGIDVLLVGDSLAGVVCGHSTTLPVSMGNMIHHAVGVSRAARRALVVVDLPFGSYQESTSQALRSAVCVMKKTTAHSVKLEGGESVAKQVRAITDAGIPVMGHLGLTPQSIHRLGSYATRAKEAKEAENLKKEAVILAEAGCFALVLEKIPATLAKEVSQLLPIPVVGIGAGPHVDGQVLVVHDMLGMSQHFHPRFLRVYAKLDGLITRAVASYIADVKKSDFPSASESY